MKIKNIPDSPKSKSLKETKKEIDEILQKLENKNTNLTEAINDYKRLIDLNKHIDVCFKKRAKEISTIGKQNKKNNLNEH